MKKLLTALFVVFFLIINLTPVSAQTEPVVGEIILENETASPSSATSKSASLASPSAEIEQKIQEKQGKDITDTSGAQKTKLAIFLDENPPGPLSWNNFVQYAIRYAVSEGVPPTTIVLVLLFPLVASLIAASRHIIGLRGFGIYSPAVLSVALVSTGFFEGILIFLAIVITALGANAVLRKTKLSYLPRTALLMETISLGIFALIVIAPTLNIVDLVSLNIFPILILVLLAENFLDAQGRTKQAEAIALTVETLGLAVVASLILRWEPMQKLVLLEPELLIISIALLDLLIGKFVGLRISERFRFRALIEEEE